MNIPILHQQQPMDWLFQYHFNIISQKFSLENSILKTCMCKSTIPGLDCLRTVVSEAFSNLSQISISCLSSYRFVLNMVLMAARQALTAAGFLFSVVLADISRNVPRVRWRIDGKADMLPRNIPGSEVKKHFSC